MDKQKALYIGGGVLVVGAIYYFATRPAPVENAPVSGMPAIMYGGSGGGGGGWQMPDMSVPDIPIPDLAAPGPVEVIPFDMYFDAMVRSDNAWALASLPTDYNSATIVHDGQNTSIVIDRPAPSYAPSEILAFISQQEKAGVPINTASILSMSAQYGVPVETIGAAYGKTPNQTYQWLYENVPSSNSTATSNQTTYTPAGGNSSAVTVTPAGYTSTSPGTISQSTTTPGAPVERPKTSPIML